MGKLGAVSPEAIDIGIKEYLRKNGDGVPGGMAKVIGCTQGRVSERLQTLLAHGEVAVDRDGLYSLVQSRDPFAVKRLSDRTED